MDLLTPDPPPDSVVRDDQLRLIFTCCHPSLSLEAQVALALRTLCQLSVDQVAAVLLTSPAAMAKRLIRTRQKIATAAIPYRIPADTELPSRLAGVCGVVHALYTAGHAPLGGAAVVDVDGCAEAIRLARLIHELMPDEAMPTAVTGPAAADRVPADRPDECRRRGGGAGGAGPDPLGRRGRRGGDGVGQRVAAADLRTGRSLPVAGRHRRRARPRPELRPTDWTEIVRLYDLLLGRGAQSGGSAGSGGGGRRTRRRGARAGRSSTRCRRVRAGTPFGRNSWPATGG